MDNQWWWNLLNTTIIATIISLIFGSLVSYTLYRLNASFQQELTTTQFKNDAFLRFGALGQEMWLLSGHAYSLHGKAESQEAFRNTSLEMLYQQGRLRALRLPLLLHFDDSEENLSKQLLEIGNTFQKIRDMLRGQPLNRDNYKIEQDKFHEAYARLYADLALQIQKGHRATREEIEKAALVVMVK